MFQVFQLDMISDDLQLTTNQNERQIPPSFRQNLATIILARGGKSHSDDCPFFPF